MFPRPSQAPETLEAVRRRDALSPPFAVTIFWLSTLQAHSGENWHQFERDNIASNASEASISAGPLVKNWQRTFTNHQSTGATTEYFRDRFSSCNLVTRGPCLALVGADGGDTTVIIGDDPAHASPRRVLRLRVSKQ